MNNILMAQKYNKYLTKLAYYELIKSKYQIPQDVDGFITDLLKEIESEIIFKKDE